MPGGAGQACIEASGPRKAPVSFDPRVSVEQVEEGDHLAPAFDERGLIPCITTDADSGDVLMLGWMDRVALAATRLMH